MNYHLLVAVMVVVKKLIHVILNHYANPKIYNKTLIKFDEK